MKDSMGELTFTIIIIVAAGLILAFVGGMLNSEDEDSIFGRIRKWWDNTDAQVFNEKVEHDFIIIENI